VKISFFPATEPESLQIIVDTPGGTTLEETAEIAESVQSYLKTVPEIQAYNITVGGNEVDRAVVSVIFDDKPNQDIDGFKILKDAEKAFARIPGAKVIVNGSAGQGPPVGKPVSLKIIGKDLDVMKELADTYAEIYDTIDGVYNIDVDAVADSPQVKINIHEKKIGTYGLSVSQIAAQLRNQMDGVVAATIQVDREEVDVVVKVDRDEMTDLNALKSMYIITPAKEALPLAHLADIDEYSGLSSIAHLDSERVITLEADLAQGVNINDVTRQFEKQAENIVLPADIRTEYGGDIEAIQESFTDLFRSMLLVVFLVFIILSVQFNSVAQPFAILMTVPMAMIGVIAGLAITGNEFGFYAFMGLVALVGIAVNDAIVLIDFMNYIRRSGGRLTDAILEAGTIRFNPVLATTLTTIGGVLPLAFRDIYYAQFSFSLVFGLLVTTILTLVYIPVFYLMIEGWKEKRVKRHLTDGKEA
jgi:HAE1 family hydrophobic/amphiphilic exporter-1